MKVEFSIHAAQFFTASIYKRQPLLIENRYKDIIIESLQYQSVPGGEVDGRYKDIIIESLQYLVNDKRIELNALVIMSNHIHLIWQALLGFSPSDILASFIYKAQQI